MEEKTDEQGNVLLYHKAEDAKPVTKREARLRDAVVGLLRKAGIEVSTDWEAGQRALDEAKKEQVKVVYFRTADGEAYGFTVGGRIYLDPRIATAETPIHEYAHLWAEALRQAKPKEWERLKKLMFADKTLTDWVRQRYPELESEDELAEEVFAHICKPKL